MGYIITPGPQGWGNWIDLAEKAKLKVSPEQRKLGHMLIERNPCENVEEERFDVHNPLSSCEPATYFSGRRLGRDARYKALHPIATLAALAVWGGKLPDRYWNLASPYILADGKRGNFILCVKYDLRGEHNDVLSFIPTKEWVYRPAFVVGLTPEASEYERCWPLN